jgi:hypothetical protein
MQTAVSHQTANPRINTGFYGNRTPGAVKAAPAVKP